MTKILPRLVYFACRRPWATVAAAFACVVAALLFAASHFAMTSDASALISPKVAWRAAERRMDAAFPANGDVILVVVDGRTPELAEAATQRLTAALAGDKTHFASVYRPDGGAWFDAHGLLFLSEREVQASTAKMIEAQPFLGPLAADPSLRGVAGALTTMAEGVTRGEAGLGRIDPAMRALAEALDAQAQGKAASFSWMQLFGQGGALAAPTRRLILVRPHMDYGALMPGVIPSDAIRAAAAKAGIDPDHGVRVRLTGSVPLSDEEFASLAENWGLVAGVMAVAMLGTLWLATRSARIMAAILVTTIAGLIVTTALGLAMIGRLNLISVAFIPLFVGLGVDFGIQLAVRFQAERHEGAEPAAAIRAAVAALGSPLLLAAGAVCLGFLAFLPTAYRGLAELGLIASVGMAVALIASMTLLPALLMLVRTGRPAAEIGTPALARADAWLMAKRRWVLGTFVVALVASIALLPLVRFDFDPLHLRNQTSEAMATLADLRADPDRNPNTIDILAPDVAAAKALAARIERLPEVERVLTAASFVPEGQAAKLATIADAGMILDVTLNPVFPEAAPGDGFTVDALRAAADALERAVRTSAVIPAKAGIHGGDGLAPPRRAADMDPGVRRDDQSRGDVRASTVIPAQAGIHIGEGGRPVADVASLDSRLRGNDEGGRDALRLAAAFRRLADGPPGARAAATQALVPPLETMLGQVRASLTAQGVTLDNLPPDLRRDWIGKGGAARVQVVPKAQFASGAGLARFTDAVLAVAPDATGTAVSIQGAARTIAQAFIVAGVLALVIVSALLFAALRDVKEVAFTLAPVVLSGFLTLGTCVLIGQPINYANIIAFPLLFGVGVAFHIYFVMAWRAGATDLLQSSLARAIFFSAMATGTAFGSLWLSHHPGTASMGKVLMLSLVWTLVCALVFEPALLGPPRKDVRPR